MDSGENWEEAIASVESAINYSKQASKDIESKSQQLSSLLPKLERVPEEATKFIKAEKDINLELEPGREIRKNVKIVSNSEENFLRGFTPYQPSEDDSADYITNQGQSWKEYDPFRKSEKSTRLPRKPTQPKGPKVIGAVRKLEVSRQNFGNISVSMSALCRKYHPKSKTKKQKHAQKQKKAIRRCKQAPEMVDYRPNLAFALKAQKRAGSITVFNLSNQASSKGNSPRKKRQDRKSIKNPNESSGKMDTPNLGKMNISYTSRIGSAYSNNHMVGIKAEGVVKAGRKRKRRKVPVATKNKIPYDDPFVLTHSIPNQRKIVRKDAKIFRQEDHIEMQNVPIKFTANLSGENDAIPIVFNDYETAHTPFNESKEFCLTDYDPGPESCTHLKHEEIDRSKLLHARPFLSTGKKITDAVCQIDDKYWLSNDPEWTKISQRVNGRTPALFTNHRKANAIWCECQVFLFDEQKESYKVEYQSNQETIVWYVRRNALLFQNEDPFCFYERFRLANECRKIAMTLWKLSQFHKSLAVSSKGYINRVIDSRNQLYAKILALVLNVQKGTNKGLFIPQGMSKVRMEESGDDSLLQANDNNSSIDKIDNMKSILKELEKILKIRGCRENVIIQLDSLVQTLFTDMLPENMFTNETVSESENLLVSTMHKKINQELSYKKTYFTLRPKMISIIKKNLGEELHRIHEEHLNVAACSYELMLVLKSKRELSNREKRLEKMERETFKWAKPHIVNKRKVPYIKWGLRVAAHSILQRREDWAIRRNLIPCQLRRKHYENGYTAISRSKLFSTFTILKSLIYIHEKSASLNTIIPISIFASEWMYCVDSSGEKDVIIFSRPINCIRVQKFETLIADSSENMYYYLSNDWLLKISMKLISDLQGFVHNANSQNRDNSQLEDAQSNWISNTEQGSVINFYSQENHFGTGVTYSLVNRISISIRDYTFDFIRKSCESLIAYYLNLSGCRLTASKKTADGNLHLTIDLQKTFRGRGIFQTDLKLNDEFVCEPSFKDIIQSIFRSINIPILKLSTLESIRSLLTPLSKIQHEEDYWFNQMLISISKFSVEEITPEVFRGKDCSSMRFSYSTEVNGRKTTEHFFSYLWEFKCKLSSILRESQMRSIQEIKKTTFFQGLIHPEDSMIDLQQLDEYAIDIIFGETNFDDNRVELQKKDENRRPSIIDELEELRGVDEATELPDKNAEETNEVDLTDTIKREHSFRNKITTMAEKKEKDPWEVLLSIDLNRSKMLHRCRREVRRLQAVHDRIMLEFPSQMNEGVFLIECTEAKSELVKLCVHVKNTILKKVAMIAQKSLDRASELYKSIEEQLEAPIKNAEDVHLIWCLGNELEKNYLKLIKKNFVDPARDVISMLDELNFQQPFEWIRNDVKNMIYPKKLMTRVQRSVEIANNRAITLKSELNIEKLRFMSQVERLALRVHKFHDYDDLSKAVSYATEAEALQDDVSMSVKMMEDMKMKDAILSPKDHKEKGAGKNKDKSKDKNDPDNVYRLLEKLVKNFRLYFDLWTVTADSMESLEACNKGKFFAFDVQAMKQQLSGENNWIGILGDVIRLLPKNNYSALATAKVMKDRLEEFTQIFPLVVLLRTPFLRTRHWIALGQEMEPDDERILLSTLGLDADDIESETKSAHSDDGSDQEQSTVSIEDNSIDDPESKQVPIDDVEKQELNLKDSDITLESFIDMNITKYYKEIKQICKQAEREYLLEVSLTDMKEKFLQAQLGLSRCAESESFIFTAANSRTAEKELLQLTSKDSDIIVDSHTHRQRCAITTAEFASILEDQEVTILTIMNSPYSRHPTIRSRAKNWSKRLTYMKAWLDQVIKCQTAWQILNVYLSPKNRNVLEQEEVKEKVDNGVRRKRKRRNSLTIGQSSEFQAFQGVDRLWKSSMYSIAEHKPCIFDLSSQAMGEKVENKVPKEQEPKATQPVEDKVNEGTDDKEELNNTKTDKNDDRDESVDNYVKPRKKSLVLPLNVLELETLAKMNKILDDISKLLWKKLGAQRAEFPRLFFLTNEQLLKLLSSGRIDPFAVRGFIPVLFPGIQHFKAEWIRGKPENVIQNADAVLHIYELCGHNESLDISQRPIIVATEVEEEIEGEIIKSQAYAPVENWLKVIEATVKKTLVQYLSEALTDSPRGLYSCEEDDEDLMQQINQVESDTEFWEEALPILNWLEQCPLQMLVIAKQILTAKDYIGKINTKVVKEGGSIAFIENREKNTIVRKISFNDIADKYKGSQTYAFDRAHARTLERIALFGRILLMKSSSQDFNIPKMSIVKIGNLISYDTYFLDRLDEYQQKNFLLSSFLEYIPVFNKRKESGNELTSVSYRIMNMEFEYGFEFNGESTRLIMTPLTARCFRSLALATRAIQFGGLSGSNGVGKSETIQDFIEQIGRRHVSIPMKLIEDRCGHGLGNSVKIFDRLLLGTYSSGACAIVEDMEYVSKNFAFECLHKIRKLIAALQARETHFSLSQDSSIEPIKLHQQCRLYFTISKVGEIQQLFGDSKERFLRPCHMAQPNIYIITKTLLASIGVELVETSDLSRSIIGCLAAVDTCFFAGETRCLTISTIRIIIKRLALASNSQNQSLKRNKMAVGLNTETAMKRKRIQILEKEISRVLEGIVSRNHSMELILNVIQSFFTMASSEKGKPTLEKRSSLLNMGASDGNIGRSRKNTKVISVSKLMKNESLVKIAIRYTVMCLGYNDENEVLISKCLELFDTLESSPFPGIIISGQPYSGKTTILKVLALSLSILQRRNVYSSRIFTESLSSNELLGCKENSVDPQLSGHKLWKDGLFALALMNNEQQRLIPLVENCEDFILDEISNANHSSESPLTEIWQILEKEKSEGVLPNTLSMRNRWILLDGEPKTTWVNGSIDSFLKHRKYTCDTGHAATLGNDDGSTFALNGQKILIETCDLSQASPSVLCSCASFFVSTKPETWRSVIQTWLDSKSENLNYRKYELLRLPPSFQKHREQLHLLADWIFPATISLVNSIISSNKEDAVIISSDLESNSVWLVTRMVTFLNLLLNENKDIIAGMPDSRIDKKATLECIESAFFFSIIWTMGGCCLRTTGTDNRRHSDNNYVELSTRVFDNVLRRIHNGRAKSEKFVGKLSRKSSSKLLNTTIPLNKNEAGNSGAVERFLELVPSHLTTQKGRCPFPSEGTVFDYVFNFSTRRWVPWNMGTQTNQMWQGNIFRWTPAMGRNEHLLSLFIRNQKNILCVGPGESGKTTLVSLVMEKLRCKNGPFEQGFDEETKCISLSAKYTLSKSTESTSLRELFESTLEQRKVGEYGPMLYQSLSESLVDEEDKHREQESTASQAVVFIDDLHVSIKGMEWVRQALETRRWYTSTKDNDVSNKMVDTSIIAALSNDSVVGGSDAILSRSAGRFDHIIRFSELNSSDFLVIFTSLMHSHSLFQYDAGVDEEEIASFYSGVVKTVSSVWSKFRSTLPRSDSNPHFVFRVRELRQALLGFCFTYSLKGKCLSNIKSSEEEKIVFLSNLVYSCERAFADRVNLANGNIRKIFNAAFRSHLSINLPMFSSSEISQALSQGDIVSTSGTKDGERVHFTDIEDAIKSGQSFAFLSPDCQKNAGINIGVYPFTRLSRVVEVLETIKQSTCQDPALDLCFSSSPTTANHVSKFSFFQNICLKTKASADDGAFFRYDSNLTDGNFLLLESSGGGLSQGIVQLSCELSNSKLINVRPWTCAKTINSKEWLSSEVILPALKCINSEEHITLYFSQAAIVFLQEQGQLNNVLESIFQLTTDRRTPDTSPSFLSSVFEENLGNENSNQERESNHLLISAVDRQRLRDNLNQLIFNKLHFGFCLDPNTELTRTLLSTFPQILKYSAVQWVPGLDDSDLVEMTKDVLRNATKHNLPAQCSNKVLEKRLLYLSLFARESDQQESEAAKGELSELAETVVMMHRIAEAELSEQWSETADTVEDIEIDFHKRDKELVRHSATRIQSLFSFASLVATTLIKTRTSLLEEREKLEKAIIMINSIAALNEELKLRLETLVPKERTLQRDLEEKRRELVFQRDSTQMNKEMAEMEIRKFEDKEKEVSNLRSSMQVAIDMITPVLSKATARLNKIPRIFLAELRALRVPTKATKLIMQGLVMFLFNQNLRESSDIALEEAAREAQASHTEYIRFQQTGESQTRKAVTSSTEAIENYFWKVATSPRVLGDVKLVSTLVALKKDAINQVVIDEVRDLLNVPVILDSFNVGIDIQKNAEASGFQGKDESSKNGRRRGLLLMGKSGAIQTKVSNDTIECKLPLEAFVSWIFAVIKYREVVQSVRPKQQQLAKATGELGVLECTKRDNESKVRRAQSNLDEMTGTFEKLEGDIGKLISGIQEAKDKSQRADSLAELFSGASKQLLETRVMELKRLEPSDVSDGILATNSLISSGVAIYLCSVNPTCRASCIGKWIQYLYNQGTRPLISDEYSLKAWTGEDTSGNSIYNDDNNESFEDNLTICEHLTNQTVILSDKSIHSDIFFAYGRAVPHIAAIVHAWIASDLPFIRHLICTACALAMFLHETTSLPMPTSFTDTEGVGFNELVWWKKVPALIDPNNFGMRWFKQYFNKRKGFKVHMVCSGSTCLETKIKESEGTKDIVVVTHVGRHIDKPLIPILLNSMKVNVILCFDSIEDIDSWHEEFLEGIAMFRFDLLSDIDTISSWFLEMIMQEKPPREYNSWIYFCRRQTQKCAKIKELTYTIIQCLNLSPEFAKLNPGIELETVTTSNEDDSDDQETINNAHLNPTERKHTHLLLGDEKLFHTLSEAAILSSKIMKSKNSRFWRAAQLKITLRYYWSLSVFAARILVIYENYSSLLGNSFLQCFKSILQTVVRELDRFSNISASQLKKQKKKTMDDSSKYANSSWALLEMGCILILNESFAVCASAFPHEEHPIILFLLLIEYEKLCKVKFVESESLNFDRTVCIGKFCSTLDAISGTQRPGARLTSHDFKTGLTAGEDAIDVGNTERISEQEWTNQLRVLFLKKVSYKDLKGVGDKKKEYISKHETFNSNTAYSALRNLDTFKYRLKRDSELPESVFQVDNPFPILESFFTAKEDFDIWHRLIFVKCFRPDKFILAVDHLISDRRKQMAKKYFAFAEHLTPDKMHAVSFPVSIVSNHYTDGSFRKKRLKIEDIESSFLSPRSFSSLLQRAVEEKVGISVIRLKSDQDKPSLIDEIKNHECPDDSLVIPKGYIDPGSMNTYITDCIENESWLLVPDCNKYSSDWFSSMFASLNQATRSKKKQKKMAIESRRVSYLESRRRAIIRNETEDASEVKRRRSSVDSAIGTGRRRSSAGSIYSMKSVDSLASVSSQVSMYDSCNSLSSFSSFDTSTSDNTHSVFYSSSDSDDYSSEGDSYSRSQSSGLLYGIRQDNSIYTEMRRSETFMLVLMLMEESMKAPLLPKSLTQGCFAYSFNTNVKQSIQFRIKAILGLWESCRGNKKLHDLVFKQLALGLIFFHAVLLERNQFLKIGEFTNNDVIEALYLLQEFFLMEDSPNPRCDKKEFLDFSSSSIEKSKTERSFSIQNMVKMIAECLYGGRVVCSGQRETIELLVEYCLLSIDIHVPSNSNDLKEESRLIFRSSKWSKPLVIKPIELEQTEDRFLHKQNISKIVGLPESLDEYRTLDRGVEILDIAGVVLRQGSNYHNCGTSKANTEFVMRLKSYTGGIMSLDSTSAEYKEIYRRGRIRRKSSVSLENNALGQGNNEESLNDVFSAIETVKTLAEYTSSLNISLHSSNSSIYVPPQEKMLSLCLEFELMEFNSMTKRMTHTLTEFLERNHKEMGLVQKLNSGFVPETWLEIWRKTTDAQTVQKSQPVLIESWMVQCLEREAYLQKWVSNIHTTMQLDRSSIPHPIWLPGLQLPRLLILSHISSFAHSERMLIKKLKFCTAVGSDRSCIPNGCTPVLIIKGLKLFGAGWNLEEYELKESGDEENEKMIPRIYFYMKTKPSDESPEIDVHTFLSETDTKQVSHDTSCFYDCPVYGGTSDSKKPEFSILLPIPKGFPSSYWKMRNVYLSRGLL